MTAVPACVLLSVDQARALATGPDGRPAFGRSAFYGIVDDVPGLVVSVGRRSLIRRSVFVAWLGISETEPVAAKRSALAAVAATGDLKVSRR